MSSCVLLRLAPHMLDGTLLIVELWIKYTCVSPLCTVVLKYGHQLWEIQVGFKGLSHVICPHSCCIPPPPPLLGLLSSRLGCHRHQPSSGHVLPNGVAHLELSPTVTSIHLINVEIVVSNLLWEGALSKRNIPLASGWTLLSSVFGLLNFSQQMVSGEVAILACLQQSETIIETPYTLLPQNFVALEESLISVYIVCAFVMNYMNQTFSQSCSCNVGPLYFSD